MRRVKNKYLSQLLSQLRFTPLTKRKKQLEAAEQFLSDVEGDRQYPVEFVIFKITGFKPAAFPELPLLSGEELQDDLLAFIARLSGQLGQKAAGQGQKVYSIKELAEKLGVSTKTIERWRRRGLVARTFVFGDGRKRLGFLHSSVERFVKANTEQVAKAKDFGRLSGKNKRRIVSLARDLARRTALSRYQIIESISQKMGCAHETARYILADYQDREPDRKIFTKPSGVIQPAEAGRIFELYRRGRPVNELMERFNRSKSSIYRIIKRRRARALLAQKIEFIASNEFVLEGARQKILGTPPCRDDLSRYAPAQIYKAGKPAGSYMQTLNDRPTLNRDQELGLFRRYNFLKYLAGIRRTGLKHTKVSSRRLTEIEDYLKQAESVKKIIVESNLRLVVSVASRHAVSGMGFQDLISEGNISLMEAVEKFDYTRGVRFTTYASWVIAKDYAGKIPAEKLRRGRRDRAGILNIHQDLSLRHRANIRQLEQAGRDLVKVIRDNLDEREQYVMVNHFGLEGPAARKNKKTLQQIGKNLELSRERVRQIELEALQKLRQVLSIEEFELLTG